ncbi:Sec-independent protein translocase protein TatB [Vibrio profundum]|uniref:Sec-independent protein translocase protein TatB n=1 Tax=Vibrio profundum TaxID=2910247 RepID=UPI003D0BD3C9
MFDFSFGEIVLVFVIGLVVLGPERLPHAIRTVAKFIATAKKMMNNVTQEVTKEINVQELNAQLRQVEKLGVDEISLEFESIDNKLKRVEKDSISGRKIAGHTIK